MSALLKESRMPLPVRIAGQAFALAYATRSVVFIALVWAIPGYAIQAPPKVAIAHSRRRGSACTTSSVTSTLIDSEPPAKLEMPSAQDRVEECFNLANETVIKPPRKSQIISKLSSSIAPVARHITVPTKKLTASVAMKITPRKMVARAHAKCSSVASSVQTHIPRQLPHFKNAPILRFSPQKGAAVFASCNAAMKKLVAPDSVKWHRPRKQATL